MLVRRVILWYNITMKSKKQSKKQMEFRLYSDIFGENTICGVVEGLVFFPDGKAQKLEIIGEKYLLDLPEHIETSEYIFGTRVLKRNDDNFPFCGVVVGRTAGEYSQYIVEFSYAEETGWDAGLGGSSDKHFIVPDRNLKFLRNGCKECKNRKFCKYEGMKYYEIKW